MGLFNLLGGDSKKESTATTTVDARSSTRDVGITGNAAAALVGNLTSAFTQIAKNQAAFSLQMLAAAKSANTPVFVPLAGAAAASQASQAASTPPASAGMPALLLLAAAGLAVWYLA